MFPFISVFEIFENWSSVPSYNRLRELAVLDFAPVLWSCFDLIAHTCFCLRFLPSSFLQLIVYNVILV